MKNTYALNAWLRRKGVVFLGVMSLLLASGAIAETTTAPADTDGQPKKDSSKTKKTKKPEKPEKPKFRVGQSTFTVQATPPKSPADFNPDPGAWDKPKSETPPAPSNDLFPDQMVTFGSEPALPSSLRLPRGEVLGRDPKTKVYTYREYPLGREGLGLLPYSKPWPIRWAIPFPHWTRYQDPTHETPYMYETPRLWHPYEQSFLKGDVPIIGQDIFTNLTLKNFALFEDRVLPVPSGTSTARPTSAEFYGRGQQVFFNNDTSASIDIFQGETAFKPLTWSIHATVVQNENYLRVREDNLTNINPAGSNADQGGSTQPVQKGPQPNTAAIQAIPLAGGNSVNVASGNPGSFTSIVNPGDVFNYIAPQLTATAGARPLVQVNPLTQEIPAGKTLPPRVGGSNSQAGSHFTTRSDSYTSLQEGFVEAHLGDISDNYDFVSARVGLQPFVSDFRGFIFADTNLGARIFGNADNNRIQYNLVAFNMREKDTNSELNTFDSRDQNILIANVYKQDFLFKGYTGQLSFHMNLDDGGTHYDTNGFLVRPEPLGTVPVDASTGQPKAHDVHAYYFGWTGDGHIGRLNITHAFYEVIGTDSFNQLANQRVDINAQMAALELSYDHDWFRLKLSGFYASGDRNPTDKTARGFDSILDNPQFIGGPFSWYTHEGFNLGGTGVDFKERDSLVPDFRTSKTEGQANFVNPGVLLTGVGADIDVTPKLKAFLNVNYIWLPTTEAAQLALQTGRVRNDFGLDTSFGFKFRPFLTDNVIFSAGIGYFTPGGGYRDIYRDTTPAVPGFTSEENAGETAKHIYNVFVTLTLTY